jgi:hypothetical protein
VVRQPTVCGQFTAGFCDSEIRRNAPSGEEAGNDARADSAWRASERNDAKPESYAASAVEPGSPKTDLAAALSTGERDNAETDPRGKGSPARNLHAKAYSSVAPHGEAVAIRKPAPEVNPTSPPKEETKTQSQVLQTPAPQPRVRHTSPAQSPASKVPPPKQEIRTPSAEARHTPAPQRRVAHTHPLGQRLRRPSRRSKRSKRHRRRSTCYGSSAPGCTGSSCPATGTEGSSASTTASAAGRSKTSARKR